jgi:hypothetical protein
MTQNRNRSRIRRAVRRLDDWTLTVFNPSLPANRRR